jgi:hypothetical protein
MSQENVEIYRQAIDHLNETGAHQADVDDQCAA